MDIQDGKILGKVAIETEKGFVKLYLIKVEDKLFIRVIRGEEDIVVIKAGLIIKLFTAAILKEK